MIIEIIQTILLFEANSNRPANDLRKKPVKEDIQIADILLSNVKPALIILLIIAAFIAFVLIMMALVGASGVESGTYYNHFDEVVR